MSERKKWSYPEELTYTQIVDDNEQLSFAKMEWIKRRRFRWLGVATWYVFGYPSLRLILLDADTERKSIHRAAFYANEIAQLTRRLEKGN